MYKKNNIIKSKSSITLDTDVHLYWRNKQANISDMVNDYLKGLMLLENESYERAEVEKEIEEIKEKMRVINQDLTNAHLKLAQINKEEQEKQERVKAQEQANYQLGRSLKLINPARFE